MFPQVNILPNSERTSTLLGKIEDLIQSGNLNQINFNIGKVENEFALKVFGVITQEQVSLLNRYLTGDLNTDLKLKREAKKIGIKLLRILQGYNGNEISLDFDKSNAIKHNHGLALEYFIVEIVSRLHKYNGVKVEKGPAELEPNKIDFVLTKDRIKYGIQLTTVESISIKRKNQEISELRNYCNNGELDKVLKGKISSQFIPDVPILMVVNSSLSRLANTQGILGATYSRWKNNGYNKTPDYYISNKHAREELNEIGLSLPNIISEGIKFIKANYSDQRIKEQRVGNLGFYFDGKDNLKISYYSQNPNDNNVQEFIYSIEIFITKKLLRKLGITPILRIIKNIPNRRKK